MFWQAKEQNHSIKDKIGNRDITLHFALIQMVLGKKVARRYMGRWHCNSIFKLRKYFVFHQPSLTVTVKPNGECTTPSQKATEGECERDPH